MYATAIPIGLPLLVVNSYYLRKDAADTGTGDEGNDDLSEGDDASYRPQLSAPGSADACGDE